MTMTMTRALMLAMRGFKIPREISCTRMNVECGDILVSRAEACAASPDDDLVRPFGNWRHRRGDGGSTIGLVRGLL
jgi:hypothetical protein